MTKIVIRNTFFFYGPYSAQILGSETPMKILNTGEPKRGEKKKSVMHAYLFRA